MDDEVKRKDVSVGSGDTDGGETLAEPTEVVLEGNNGEDIMVEVLGSDVFVDGVRSHDGEGESAGEVGHGGPGADSGVQSSKGAETGGIEVQDTTIKEVGNLENDAEVSVSEMEEDLVVQDTQLLDEDTQPVEESLEAVVAERSPADGSEDTVVEKGVQDPAETGNQNDEQPADQSVNAVEQKTTRETSTPEEKSEVKSLDGEDNVEPEDNETDTNVVQEVGEEKVSVAENASDKGEAKDSVASTGAASVVESHSDAVDWGVETTTVEESLVPAVVTTDAGVPDVTLNPEEALKSNGGNFEVVAAVVSDAEAVEGKTTDGTGMVDSDVGQEGEDEQQVVADAEKKTSHENKMAAEEVPLKVETATLVMEESVTVVTDVTETLEEAVSDPSVEVPDGSKVEETLTVDMVCEETQVDAQMTEANVEVLGLSADVSEPADNNQETVDGSKDVEDKEAVTDAEMADLQEDDGTETDEEKNIKQAGSPKTGARARYHLPPEKDAEGAFSVSDLVWGKVRSHPWWPGQVFDPSDASENAVKHQKKDSFLVAYFGDRTFAWNETHLLKPFRTHFPIAQKQGSSEAFQDAVDCALEEVSRRVTVGLACSCTPKEAIENIEFQVVENAGIREESSKREGAGEYAKGNCFEPANLIEYVKDLAQFPCDGADRLELVIANAQLTSFYNLKGYSLPEFVFTNGFSDDAENLPYEDENRVSGEGAGSASAEEGGEESSGHKGSKPKKSLSLKRKHNLRESTYPFKKGRSMTELMGSATEDDRRKNISVAKVMSAGSPPAVAPRPSFKIGECIKRIASQLTGSPILKAKSESDPQVSTEDAEKGAGVASDYSSMEDLLSQLQVAAQEPMQEHSFANMIACFFSDFRNSVVLDQNPELGKPGGGGKRKRMAHIDGSSEAFEFEDMNDSYWTDRIIENGEDEEPHSDGVVKRVENQLVPIDSRKPQKTGRRPYTKRRLQENHHELPPQKPPGYIAANAPAELVMMFPEFGYLPSEANLSRMFKRFGPIRESETEVDREASRARIVFKKCSDAEVACSSAGRFNIFGPIQVTYQLNYSVSDMFRSSLAMMEVHEEDGM